MSRSTYDNRSSNTRIRIRIPKEYQHEPIISNLVSQYGLSINITAALLSCNARDDGWFDLDLQGTSQQTHEAILYLNDLNIEIWRDSDCTTETW